MRCIAQERDAAYAPTRERRQIVEIVQQDDRLIGGLDNLLDRFVPAFEELEQVRLG